ncbi:unnamed protein product [Rotaria sordida]|uniref:Ig-like domain-containing protein n=1 Tax=Rotaria sordida TaxID=392033 RepID=A0A815C547_9BILA|nr:unnamed protein product [Rotaria sordida]
MYYNGFIIFLFILIVQSYGFLRLENMTVTYDEHVEFRCSLPKNFLTKDNIIQWKKLRSNDDDLIIAINGKVPVRYEKFYHTDLTNQFSTLELYHVKRHDSTTYICQTFETQTILCQYNLVVLIKPESPTLTINEENIQEYQTVKLTCSSLNGNPPPQYTWYRNGTLLTSLNQQVSMMDNSSIYTFNVSRFDNQVKYECQISNQALINPLRVEQYLHVKYRPYVEILAQPSLFITNEKLIGIESNEQRLTCLIDANPTVTSVYWTINSTNIISREINVYLSRLTSEQSGVYTCVVENAIGKVNQSIYLDVQYAPRVYAIESRVIVNRSNSAILRCYVDSNPLPYQIIWFKNGYEIFRQNQLSDLRIDHVERNDSGLYTCIIYNRLYNNLTRNGSSIIELIVQSRPILETTYSKIAAEIGQTITLICRVSGQPKPNIFWKRNEQFINCDEIIDDKCYLRLFHITKKDFGSYRCIAENLLGREEWTYTIVSRDDEEENINQNETDKLSRKETRFEIHKLLKDNLRKNDLQDSLINKLYDFERKKLSMQIVPYMPIYPVQFNNNNPMMDEKEQEQENQNQNSSPIIVKETKKEDDDLLFKRPFPSTPYTVEEPLENSTKRTSKMKRSYSQSVRYNSNLSVIELKNDTDDCSFHTTESDYFVIEPSTPVVTDSSTNCSKPTLQSNQPAIQITEYFDFSSRLPSNNNNNFSKPFEENDIDMESNVLSNVNDKIDDDI